MRIFGFKARSADRDRETDRGRFARLARELDAVATEIAAERDAFHARYLDAAGDAAFLAEAMASGEAPERSDARLSDLGANLRAAEKRLAALDRQIELLAETRRGLDRGLGGEA